MSLSKQTYSQNAIADRYANGLIDALSNEQAASTLGGTNAPAASIVDEDDCTFPGKGAQLLGPELSPVKLLTPW